jgi:hypothetical protein
MLDGIWKWILALLGAMWLLGSGTGCSTLDIGFNSESQGTRERTWTIGSPLVISYKDTTTSPDYSSEDDMSLDAEMIEFGADGPPEPDPG